MNVDNHRRYRDMNENDKTKHPEDPTLPHTGESIPSAVRAKPEDFKQHDQEGKEKKDNEENDATDHMGANEDQVVPGKPPTGALSEMLDSDDDPTEPGAPIANDELTPG
jgi:hypothetical protein